MRNLLTCALIAITSFQVLGQTGSYSETLRRMFEVSGTEESYEMAVKQMVAQFKEMNAEVPVEFWNRTEEAFLETSLDDLTEMLVPVYQQYFTQADLKEMIAFYETPVGKKFALHTPAVMQESMQVGGEWGQKIGLKIMEELEAEGY